LIIIDNLEPKKEKYLKKKKGNGKKRRGKDYILT